MHTRGGSLQAHDAVLMQASGVELDKSGAGGLDHGVGVVDVAARKPARLAHHQDRAAWVLLELVGEATAPFVVQVLHYLPGQQPCPGSIMSSLASYHTNRLPRYLMQERPTAPNRSLRVYNFRITNASKLPDRGCRRAIQSSNTSCQ